MVGIFGRYCRCFDICAVLAIIVIFGFGHQAGAQTLVDPNSVVGPVPSYAGTGLMGFYYNDDGNTGPSDSEVINSVGPLTGYPPLATFLTTNICYPDCDGNSINDNPNPSGALRTFLNGNATNIQFANPNLAEPQDFSNSSLILNGYIAITTPGSYQFNLNSDDGSQLMVGDTRAVATICNSPLPASIKSRSTSTRMADRVTWI